jgi:hypothetical protein
MPRTNDQLLQQPLRESRDLNILLEQQVKTLRDEVKALKLDNQQLVLKQAHLQQQLETLLICCRSAEARSEDAHAALQRTVDKALASAEDACGASEYRSSTPVRGGMFPPSVKLNISDVSSSRDVSVSSSMSLGLKSVYSDSFASFATHVMRLAQNDVEQLAGSASVTTANSSGGNVGDIGVESKSRSSTSGNDLLLYDSLQEVSFTYCTRHA